MILAAGFIASVTTLRAQTLLHYWNFNTSTNETTLLTPTSSLVAGASITHIPGGSSAIQTTSNTTGQGFENTNPNARNGDLAGAHLRFNNPIGGTLVFALPTTGYENAIVKYASRRSGSGAGEQYIEYTTDGISYNSLQTVLPVDGDPTMVTLDFSNIPATDDNPNFKIRITFGTGPGGNVGNNRFDNFTLDADAAGAIDITPPTANILPLNGAVDLAINTQPTITFNEPVRLIDNTPLNNSNVDNIIELRLNNASGTLVPFDASVSANTITIVPTSLLLHAQTYYVALLSNTIEDLSDNALVGSPTSSFTTIVEQTAFQPGDLLFVAYRTSAVSTEDEFAFLTFVDILPGTQINFTDAKYTDNVQAQCPGGIKWTSPLNECIGAGTVVSIQNDALTTSKGTVTGSSFGLSSGGDQVIAYTGTAAAPQYITAFSSNAWVANNTACGGSISKLPAPLSLLTDAISLATATGNVSGNSANAFYNGIQTGTSAAIKTALLDPTNWTTSPANSAPQTWPIWNFPGAPSITGVYVMNQTTVQVYFSNDLDITSANDITNYTGINNISTATVTNNGSAIDTVTLVYATPFAQGGNYTLTIENISNTLGLTMVCPYTYSFTYNTTFTLLDEFISVSEDTGIVNIRVQVSNPSDASVDLVLKAAPFSNTNASDITFTAYTINTDGTSIALIEIPVTILNDTDAEQDEYFVLELQNAQSAAIVGTSYITVYIRDNDRMAPTATQEIELSHVSSFDPSIGNSTCEIVAHDPTTQRLFMTSAIQGRLDIADFSNPAAITIIDTINMLPYGGITSVAVKNGIVAVASPNADEQQNGSVVFFDTDGNFISQVTVGALPDMITFTPDGQKVLTANEGQPNNAYTIDPEGSVSIIDISGGVAGLTQANVNTLLFTNFNAQETMLINSGVRKLKATSTLSQDLEPEFITVHPNSTKAWVTLQENNAIATIDLITDSIVEIKALGTKDMNVMGNGFDISDNSGVVHLSNWPVKSFYIPDAIANYTVNGITYIVTANEGDEKEYAGLNERTTVGAANLDPSAFPHASMLKKSHNMGRFRITNLHGDVDNDGDLDELYSVGTRSFSIRNANDMSLVYDSGDDFELITSTHPDFGVIFNSDHENNSFKGRSRAKGPEPEGVTIAQIGNSTFAFVALERVGGVMVYNITDPANVQFVDYKNNRSTSAYQGDLGPESVIYINPQNSPDNKHYVLVANEISGTISVFEILHAAPQFTLGNDTAFCIGNATTLTAPAGYNYAWSNGESNQSINVNTSGTYSVNVVAINGNTSSDTVNVVVNPLPTVNFNGLNMEYFIDDQPVVLTGFPAGGTFSGTGILQGNQFWPSNAGAGGPYTVTYSYTNPTTGCSNSYSNTVTVLIDYTGVEEMNNPNHVSIYPNPSTDVVNINIELVGEQSIQIELVDLQGRAISIAKQGKMAAGNYVYNIDKNALGLKAGTYFISIKTGNSETKARIIFL